MAAGRDTIVPTVQMSVMPTRRVLWDFLGASGVIIACDDDYIKDLLSPGTKDVGGKYCVKVFCSFRSSRNACQSAFGSNFKLV